MLSEKDWLILVIVVAALLLALLIYVWARRCRRKEEEQYAMRIERHEEVSDQVQVETQQDEKPEASILEECRERVNELAEKLGVREPGGKIAFFDEECELNDDGYMFALMKIPGDKKIWIIFYPNTDCNVILLVFDRKVSWDTIEKMKNIIDEFYEDEAELYGEDDDCPAYIWEDEFYDKDAIGIDVANAAEKDPDWIDLSQQF